MAGALKRRRATVSYKEPSSDDDDNDSGDTAGGTSSRRKRVVRQRTSTRHSPRNAASTSARDFPLRQRQKISYRESSPDEDPDADFAVQEATTASPRKRRTRNPPSPHLKTDKKPKPRSSRALGAPYRPKTTNTASPRKIVSDGIIPPWSTLPYHVLLQIFVYASHPLHDENLTPTASISWLARTARICSTFAKPALTALYRNPPIFAIRQNRQALVWHLASPPPDAFFDYPVMVKRLELDATRMSKLIKPGTSVDALVALIRRLKTLKEIDIFDPFDKPPYRERSRGIRRWTYPEELFVALRQSELHLLSWRWNSTYCARGHLWIKEVHSSPAFQSLREVSFTKFRCSDSRNRNAVGGVPTAEELLGSTLAVLPNLKSLTFETCTALNNKLLPMLPSNLVSLNITNCRDVTSDALQAFLVTHGSSLKELTLNHNQSLDLSFLVSLKQHCPRLEVLRMDMHYYNTLSTSSDNEPLYDELLLEGEIPSWPSTMKTVDMEFLRNWSATSAIAFFTSLIDSAPELPQLREIIVTAIVDVDWRQRAEFRKKWTDRFQKVFARKLGSPDPTLMSLRAFRESKESHDHAGVDSVRPPSVADPVSDEPEDVEDDTTDVQSTSKKNRKDNEKWGSRRLRSRGKASANYEETSGTSDDDSDSGSDEVHFIQGMCHTVVFRIDNSRPNEQIYDEQDFLDEEASGDEDWNGNDIVDDEYAW